MLDKLKKLLGAAESKPVIEAATEAVEALAAPEVASPEASAAIAVTASPEFSVMRETLEAASAALSGDLAIAVSQLEKMTAAFNTAQAALNALTAEKAEMVVKAEAAKFTARKEKVVLVIGTEKADGLMLATQGLDDTSFDAVVKALAGSVDVEASAGLFKEVGVSAVADTTKIVAESPEMKILKQKFKSAK